MCPLYHFDGRAGHNVVFDVDLALENATVCHLSSVDL